MSKLPTLLVPGSLKGEGVDPRESPVNYITRWLRKRMPEFGWHSATLADRVLVVLAETGSGKSTVLPVAIFRILRSPDTAANARFRGPGVICTQPRVLTAIALASDVSSERLIGNARVRINPDMVLGLTVGFQTGPVSNRPTSGLVYATAGVLAAQLRMQSDTEIMNRYRFIIVDEAHERSLDSDMTLMLLRDFYQRNAGNERLPFLLLTSATIDTSRYADYFGVGPANVIEVSGRAYPIETHWPAQGTNDYAAAAAEVAIRIHEEHPDDPPERADIMIFMPGAAEMNTVSAALLKANRKYTDREAPGPHRPVLVLNINREVVISQTGDFPLVFEKPGLLPSVGGQRPARRVIITTVVAETGLTVDTLRYVVDCGWGRTREVYQPWGLEGLITRPISWTRIRQRKGRAGRLFPGDFYPLYTQNVHDALDAAQLPDIISTGSGGIHLVAIREQQRQKLRTGRVPEFRVEDLSLLDPPPPEAFLAANAAAVALGFVSSRAPLPDAWPPAVLTEAALDGPAPGPLAPARGYGLTALGHIAAMFTRVGMEGARVLLAGYQWGAAASDLAAAVAMFGTSAADLYTAAERQKKGGLPTGADALRAALPPYLVQRTGGAAPRAALPPTESEAFYFRAKLLIADDFIEALLIFDAFARQLDASEGDIRAAAKWCRGLGLSFDKLLEFARRRELVVEEMLVAGLNPFRGADRRLAGLPQEEFVDGVVRFKRCLYEGLRHRLLEYAPDHPDGPGYLTRQGVRVVTPGLFTDQMASRLHALGVTREQSGSKAWRPRWLLSDLTRLLPTPARGEDKAPPLLYTVSTNLVCVVDGFFDPDPDFDGPRVF